MQLKQSLKEKLERLDTIPDAFVDKVTGYQKDFNANVLALINSLDVDDGVVATNTKNLETLGKISNELKGALLGKRYLIAVREFVLEFDEQATVIQKYLIEEFGEFVINDIAYQSLQIAKENAAELFIGQSTKSRILDPIQNEIRNAINAGSSYVDLVKNIQNFTTGTETTDGLLTRYAKQLSYDAFAISDRNFTQLATIDLGLEFYIYAGGLIKDTRDFCQTRNGKYYHYNEVSDWGNLKQWDGKYKGTDTKTIFLFAGGYNCRHSIVPVSMASVPKDVLIRNIANGNFKPTTKEKDLLQI
jgi:hypothetical protein